MKSEICKVGDLDPLEHFPERGGLIIYTMDGHNRLRFCMGVDSKTGDITDFAGGISYKKDKNFIRGSLREMNEETLGVFGEIKESHIIDQIAVYNKKSITIFFFIPEINERFIIDTFLRKVGSLSTEHEIRELKWFDEKDFEFLVKKRHYDYHLYSRVSNLLSPVMVRSELFRALGKNTGYL